MPDIDVTGVLSNSAVAAEPFSVIRRTQTVNASGQAVIVAAAPVQAIGGISPVGDNSLLREEAFQTQMNAIKVITAFRLRTASKDPGTGVMYQPDLVLWSGTYYLVRDVNDYSKYGAGFVEADCIQIDWNDVPIT